MRDIQFSQKQYLRAWNWLGAFTRLWNRPFVQNDKKYWCSNSHGGHIIVATGKLATRTASCRASLHDRTILLSLFRHRTFPRLRQLARADMWVPATVVTAEKSLLGGKTYCKRTTINPCPMRVNKIVLFTTTIVTWQSSDSVLTWRK